MKKLFEHVLWYEKQKLKLHVSFLFCHFKLSLNSDFLMCFEVYLFQIFELAEI